MIDAAYTAHNRTLVNDGTGALVPMQRVEEAVAFLDTRIAQTQNTRKITDKHSGEVREVPVAIRKDASVAVEFVLMLDPRYTRDPGISDLSYDAMSPEERAVLPPDVAHMTPEAIADVREKLHAMVAEVSELMGSDNVVFVAEHWDESHPHVQMAVVPVTADGKLSKKQVLGERTMAAAQAKYAAMHDSMRERLRSFGYEATSERVDAGRPHQPTADFKASKDRTRREKASLAVAKRDADKLWEERQHVKAQREALVREKDELPQLRSKARSAGYAEGRELAERDIQEALLAAQQVYRDAAAERDAAVAYTARLRGLNSDIERELEAAGAPPPAPTYDEMRAAILDEQSAVMVRFLKSVKRPDGTTLFDTYETYAKAEFARSRHGQHPLGQREPGFENWRNRTVAVQRRLNRLSLTDSADTGKGQGDDHQLG
ncbi:plasmid recombination protein [Okibacterium fritillariae]|nr:plasmid recombination protein [Okibacterium fritillariae]